jgi:four helix bundle protein
MAVRNYRELIAWQKAMDLVEAVYKVTVSFPKEELYGLTSQVRRAAVSIPANIAEGQGRKSSREFLHFLSIAHGSLRETETHVLIAQRLHYCTDNTANSLLAQAAEVGRLVNGLTNSLEGH